MFLRLFIFTLFLFVMNISARNPPIEAGVSQTLAKWRAANYSNVRYKLNLTLEKMSPTLKGTIEISLKNNADQIVLDWRKIRGKEDLSTISNVSLNGKTAKYEEINEHLVFRDGVTAGENVVKLDFTSPILTSGGAITRYVDKEDGAEYIYSLFVPSDASTAFPVFDQPDLKARFKLSLDIPNNWRYITNTPLFGLPVIKDSFAPIGKPEINYRKTYYEFKETKPISTYVFAFAAGEFAKMSEPSALADGLNVDDKTSQSKVNPPANADGSDFAVRIYVRKSQAEKFKPYATETFRLNREAVKYLESYFDYKFPFPKYDLVLLPEFPFGGMEHAGATFLREDRIIFPTEPTKNDFVTRANLIFHEAAHQWFGDMVTMRWFDDLWLKEGFAEFMAYKTLEKVMPEYNSWKIFYERNKQAAYLTDSTRGTTPIYQEIPNLSAAKSAYGNIVYRKAPSFLRQAEFYLGADKFQTAVRAFLKKHQFTNAEWADLMKEFETASGKDLKDWANVWVTKRGVPKMSVANAVITKIGPRYSYRQKGLIEDVLRPMSFNILVVTRDGQREIRKVFLKGVKSENVEGNEESFSIENYIGTSFVFPNYQDYGYGIFLLDEKSHAYVLANIQTEKDDFLRTMMWGALWDSVREGELNPKDYVELVIKNINVESDESTIQTLLGRVSTAMNYYLSDAQSKELAPRVENVLLNSMAKAETAGQRITFYRAYLNAASTDAAKKILKDILENNGKMSLAVDVETKTEIDAIRLISVSLPLKTKDKFDIATRLLILNDKDAVQILAALEKSETSDEAKRYAYAARAGIATTENAAKFWNDFTTNKDISESYIESALTPFNSPRHSDLTLPYLERALSELPNLKRNRKIFFVNGWLAAFIGGQRSERALQIVNKFLAANPNLDKDLRLKILENADNLERAAKIRQKFSDAK